jgi:hypothetical protein
VGHAVCWGLCGTKERDVLLREREIDRGKRLEGHQFPRIDLNQPDVRHCSRDQIGLSHPAMLLLLALLALLVHTFPWSADHVVHLIREQATVACSPLLKTILFHLL